MSLILLQIKDAMKRVLDTFLSSDLDVMSSEVRNILSNPEDAKKYRDAVLQMEKGNDKEVTIELSDKSRLTLIQ